MNCPRRMPLFVSLVALLTSPALVDAQSQNSAANTAAPAATANAPAVRPRAVSPEVANRLLLAAPRYTPPPAARTSAGSNGSASAEGVAPDLRETDRPRNGIVRLPRYLVEEPKIFVPRPHEVLTARGRLDDMVRRNPGLRFGNFWIFRNDGIALFMFEEEMRLRRLGEMSDLLTLLPANDQNQTVAQQTVNSLAIRQGDWIPRRNR